MFLLPCSSSTNLHIIYILYQCVFIETKTILWFWLFNDTTTTTTTTKPLLNCYSDSYHIMYFPSPSTVISLWRPFILRFREQYIASFCAAVEKKNTRGPFQSSSRVLHVTRSAKTIVSGNNPKGWHWLEMNSSRPRPLHNTYQALSEIK